MVAAAAISVVVVVAFVELEPSATLFVVAQCLFGRVIVALLLGV